MNFILELLHRADLKNAASNVLSDANDDLYVAFLVFLRFYVNEDLVKVLIHAFPRELDPIQLGKHRARHQHNRSVESVAMH